jgi:hypothetical protein
MGITKLLPLPIIFAVSVVCCFGQSSKTIKPDLGGTWELEVGRSGAAPEQITITHHDPQLTIRRTVTIDGVREEEALTYYTDGRGERNPVTGGLRTNASMGSWHPSETTSETTWSKDKVVTCSVQWLFAGTVVFEYEITEEWQLASDGKTLTKITLTAPKKDLTGNAAIAVGDRTLKEVYKLISK